MKVPWAIPSIGKDELAEVTDAVKTNWLSMGKRVKLLEGQLSKYLGDRHAVAVSNGTVALDLALKILGVGPRHEVILPALTYIATLNAVVYQGAQPVFADIDPFTFNIDPADIERKITSATRCIISIDYGGNPANYDELRRIARANGITLLQDAAQSIGGNYRGAPLGIQGDIATTSFHAAKIITSVEGGAIFTDDLEVAKQLRILRNQGEDSEQKYIHVLLGYNARLTDLHAAVGLAQWRKREQIFSRREKIATAYNSLLEKSSSIRLPPRVCNCSDTRSKPGKCCRNSWFFYPILVPERDRVAEKLSEAGVETRICYPMPVYEQPFFRSRDPRASCHRCPNAKKISQNVLNLPMFHTMDETQIEYVTSTLHQILL